MLILKIVFYLFHLMIGFMIGTVLSAFFGNAVGISIMVIYWIFSFRWTFFRKKKTASKALSPKDIQTLKQPSKRTKNDAPLQSNISKTTHDIEPSLEGFQIRRSAKKLKTPLKSEHLIHDDLVEFNDLDEQDNNIVNLSSVRNKNNIEDHDDSNLTDFHLASPTNWFGRKKANKKEKIRWIAPDETIAVRSYC